MLVNIKSSRNLNGGTEFILDNGLRILTSPVTEGLMPVIQVSTNVEATCLVVIEEGDTLIEMEMR